MSTTGPARNTPTGLTPGRVLSHLGVMVALSMLAGLLVGGLSVVPSLTLGWASKSVAQGVESFPDIIKTTTLPQRTRVLSRGGQVVATFYSQNRVAVALKDIAPVMRTAQIAIEDYRYYQHGAIDLKGTARAFVTNQSNGGTVQGGSSITQQLAKMTLVLQAHTPAERRAATADTIWRKIRELSVAMGFEKRYSKNWILDRYLNTAYFGDGAYGVEQAARHYFSVDASQLTLKQAALLAGLVKNPDAYNPVLYPQAAIDRRNTVLARMAQLHKVPAATANRLYSSGLGLNVSANKHGCVDSTASFYCDYVLRYLLDDPSLGRTKAERLRLINTGGLTIKTNLDLRYQRAADSAVSRAVFPTDQAVGALAEVVPGSGAVRAIAQSRPMGTDRSKGQTYIDYVVPNMLGGSLGFPGGSTFKAFVLAAALEEGLPSSTTIHSPYNLTLQQNSFPDCHGYYPINAPYKLSNFSHSENGTYSMVTGMQQSVNTFFVQLEQRVGLCKPFNIAQAAGLGLSNAERVPSFTLGASNVSPLTMASAYATWAARGTYCAPQPVTQILNSNGSVFKDFAPECRRIVSKYAADTINQILHGVISPGGFGAQLILDKPAAGKTGTTDDNKSVWFDGYTPKLSTSAVVGGANQVGHPITLNYQTVGGYAIGSHAFGSTVAGPMWYNAMQPIEGLYPYADFSDPALDPHPLTITTP